MSLAESQCGGLAWRKARLSTANGACVEVASAGKRIAVRDSKNPDGPVLLYIAADFGAFVAGAKRGEFDDLP